jgi:hypothetical protein
VYYEVLPLSQVEPWRSILSRTELSKFYLIGVCKAPAERCGTMLIVPGLLCAGCAWVEKLPARVLHSISLPKKYRLCSKRTGPDER